MQGEIDGARVICLVPCRAGSCRLRKKNLKMFNSRMLFENTIDKALKCNFNEVILSTNDRKIQAWCLDNLRDSVRVDDRPKRLCGPKVTSEAVGVHIMKDYKDKDILVLLQCTTPLVSVEDINLVIHEIKNNPIVNAIVSINESTLQPNGGIYAIRKKVLLEYNSFYPERELYLYLMPKERSFDIDYYYQFEIAQAYSRYNIFYAKDTYRRRVGCLKKVK